MPNTPPAAAVEPARGRGWARIAATVLVFLGFAFAAWWLIRSDALRNSQHSRNFHELDIAARLIESWPKSVRYMALTNLLPSRINPTHPSNVEANWPKAARILHPRLGAVYVHYGVPRVAGEETTCPEATTARGTAGGVSFDKDKSEIRINGAIPTSEFWYADKLARGDAGEVPAIEAADQTAFAAAVGLGSTPPPRHICFKATLPLPEILDLAVTAPQIEQLLLIDRSGLVLAQVGGTPLPMASIDELNRLRPLLENVVDATEVVATQGKSGTNRKVDPGPVIDLSVPTEVSIGGRRYFAYTRTLNLPAEFPAIACKEGEAASPVTRAAAATPPAAPTSGSAAPVGSSAAAKARTCLIMGLVPTERVNTASLRLSPATLTGFALTLGILVALLPLLKLRLIGPSDALRPVEVAAVAIGIVTAVAIATLTIWFGAALIADNKRTAGQAREVARAMAADLNVEFAAATSGPVAFKKLPKELASGKFVEPVGPVGLICRRPNGDTEDAPPTVPNDALILPPLKDTVSDVGTIFRDQSGEGWWPQLESSRLFGEFGMAWPGYTPVINRCDRGARADISKRPYFRAVMSAGQGDGPHAGNRFKELESLKELQFVNDYRVGVVRAQADGIDKIVIATAFNRHPDDKRLGPQRGALNESFIARTFLAPVLPQPFSFIVVDAKEPALPVLFDSNPSRVDVDRLADDIGSANAQASIANARCVRADPRCGTSSKHFSASLDGVRQHFVAQGLVGTPWVLLVHYPADDVARPIAEAAVFAAGAWFGLALIVIIIATIAARIRGPALWRWSWPRPGNSDAYRQAALRVSAFGIAAAVICWLLQLWPGATGGYLRLLVAITTPLAAIAITLSSLRHHANPRARFLDPADESAFRNLAIVLLIAIGTLPMSILWLDSRQSSLAAADANQIAHIDRAIEDNVRTRRTLMRGFGTDSPVAVSGAQPSQAPDTIGNYARYRRDLHVPGAPIGGPLSGNLRQWTELEAARSSLSCGDTEPKRSMRHDARQIFCGTVQPVPASALADPGSNPWSVDFAAFRWFVWGLLAFGIAALLLGALGVILRCLFGHGVPLEAVNHPGVTRRPDGGLNLPAKVLILNAPLALRLELLETFEIVDLSDPAPAAIDPDKPKLLVTGLALALRDPTLRANGLVRLEHLSRAIDSAERAHDRAKNPGAPPNQLVVMTDLSPLDRILQAYESEQAKTLGEDGRREQLRWSRLFEAFSTVGFAPTSKLSPVTADDFLPAPKAETDPTDAALTPTIADDPAKVPFSANEREGIAALVNEVRDLPEVVIDSLLNAPDEAVARYWRKHTRESDYPVDPAEKLYENLYKERVRKWAESIRPASRAAAIDYLRGMLIEHYQYTWIASSHAERVILDSLARGRTVNIASAFALRSLVRRGLIRFDPVPRLINDSFAAFVLQAEKPMKIDEWRAEQPRSLWQRSSLPLMILIPLAIIALVAVALYSGERAIGLMPLLLGSAPALLGTLGALRRTT